MFEKCVSAEGISERWREVRERENPERKSRLERGQREREKGSILCNYCLLHYGATMYLYIIMYVFLF